MLSVRSMIFQTFRSKNFFHALSTFVYVLSLGIVIQIPGIGEYFEGLRPLLFLSLLSALIFYMTGFNRKFIMFSVIYVFLFVSSSLIPMLQEELIPRKEIISGFLFGGGWLAFWSLIYHLGKTQHGFLRALLCGSANFFRLLALLLPMLLWGYYLVSGGYALSSAVLLTLFQTNWNESIAYMRSQNLWFWGMAVILLLLTLWGMTAIMKQSQEKASASFSWKKSCCLLFLFWWGGPSLMTISLAYAPIRMGMETRASLADYRVYGQNHALREKRLKNLRGLHTLHAGGLYVLVIGESETRDHMQVYGYKRATTPWLSKQKETGNALFFSHAYSNYVTTVPALTYALSTRNQYNQVNLSDAYSLIEVAKAAGFNTFWISNQRKFSPWDTPVAEIGSTSDHQIWLNSRLGSEDIFTEYYDSALADKIPLPKENKNHLIVIHLMGCHKFYSDRYPANATYFKGTDYRDLYDNAVRYNDYVLEQIYQKVSASPNFKGMVYFSDHGEDATKLFDHNPSQFSWQMTRIPCIIWLSDSYRQENPKVYKTLSANQDKYWTNDLVYNLMVNLMGIQGAPENNLRWDISSPKYAMTKKDLMTLHGEKKLYEEQ